MDPMYKRMQKILAGRGLVWQPIEDRASIERYKNSRIYGLVSRCATVGELDRFIQQTSKGEVWRRIARLAWARRIHLTSYVSIKSGEMYTAIYPKEQYLLAVKYLAKYGLCSSTQASYYGLSCSANDRADYLKCLTFIYGLILPELVHPTEVSICQQKAIQYGNEWLTYVHSSLPRHEKVREVHHTLAHAYFELKQYPQMIVQAKQAIFTGEDLYAFQLLIEYYASIADLEQMKFYLQLAVSTLNFFNLGRIANTLVYNSCWVALEELGWLAPDHPNCRRFLLEHYLNGLNSPSTQLMESASAWAFQFSVIELFPALQNYLVKHQVNLQYWLRIPLSYFSGDDRALRLAHGKALMEELWNTPTYFQLYPIRDVHTIIQRMVTT